MNILIACDSFKDALDSMSVCLAIESGVRMKYPNAATKIFPLGDGGEGTTEVLKYHLGLKPKTLIVNDPLFRRIKATYYLSENGDSAFIEMAQAAGLQLLKKDERNPMMTTTFGVGEMICDAIESGVKNIVLGIGGSATNDAGIGMACALGWQFLDAKDDAIQPIGANLSNVRRVIPPSDQWLTKLKSIKFDVICDVKNSLYGPNGAAFVYARQKGANEKEIELLNIGLKHISELIDPRNYQHSALELGSGAAGGLGFGCRQFLDAELKSGIETVLMMTNFEKAVAWADFIITGEGRLDSQTYEGKLIHGVIKAAKGKLVIALCGQLSLTEVQIRELGLSAAYEISPRNIPLSEALRCTSDNLQKFVSEIELINFISS